MKTNCSGFYERPEIERMDVVTKNRICVGSMWLTITGENAPYGENESFGGEEDLQ